MLNATSAKTTSNALIEALALGTLILGSLVLFADVRAEDAKTDGQPMQAFVVTAPRFADSNPGHEPIRLGSALPASVTVGGRADSQPDPNFLL
jgi:hypothetical protein